MQISAQTLLASQQAAAMQPRTAPGFSAALEKVEAFAPLPLKQTAAPAPQAAPSGPVSRPGARLDITI